MGTVYEAEHIEIGRRVAVKILAAEHTRNPEALASFRDEARASAKIGAANIIEIYDFVTLPDGRVLAAMELLNGTDLGFVQDEPLDPARAIGILRQLCQGLAAAHDADIVHGDVKPENLFLITREGRADFLKILDFGVATMLGQGSDRTRRVGTAAYVSPEIVLDLPRGTKVDMYAAGCTSTSPMSPRR
jgi:serine/threonine protein kinase